MTSTATRRNGGLFALPPESKYARLPNIVHIAANLNDRITRLVGECWLSTLSKKTVKETLNEFIGLSHSVANLWYEVANEDNGESISNFNCEYAEKHGIKCALLVMSLPFLEREDQIDIVAELEEIVETAREIRRMSRDK